MHPDLIREACKRVSLVVRGIHRGDSNVGACDVLHDIRALRAAMIQLVRAARRERNKTLGILTVSYPGLMTRVVRAASSMGVSEYHDTPELRRACNDISGLVVVLDVLYQDWSRTPRAYVRRPQPVALRPA